MSNTARLAVAKVRKLEAEIERLRGRAKNLRADLWAANTETKQHDKELYDLRSRLAKAVEPGSHCSGCQRYQTDYSECPGCIAQPKGEE